MSSRVDISAAEHQAAAGAQAENEQLALVMLPRLQGVLRTRFSGPHTQFACACLAASAPVDPNRKDASFWNSGMHLVRNTVGGLQPFILRHVILVVTCTQIFICDDHAFVHRTIHLERLQACYVRPVDAPKLQETDARDSAGRPQPPELEVMLVIDSEHDLLLQGKLTCDGLPPKALVPLLQVLHENVKPVAPLVVHSNNPAPLAEIARLQVPPTYRAPLPIREETHDQCPCWREGDVVNISQQEFERRVENIFTVYAPERRPETKDICRRFNRRMGGALQHLVDKYGPEPTAEKAQAVAAYLARESVNQELFASPSSRQPNYAAVAASQRAIDNAGRGHKDVPVDPLYFPALILMQRPSGGLPRIKLTIGPAPEVPAGVSLFAPYIRSAYLEGHRPVATRRPDFSDDTGFARSASLAAETAHLNTTQQHRQTQQQHHYQQQIDAAAGRSASQSLNEQREFWYLCNEGYAASFDISNEALRIFGFAHGDKVLATVGVTSGKFSTIVGVRDGTLWVHDAGALGASALVGFRNHEDLERLNGWMLAETVKLNELRFMDVLTEGGFYETLDISPETLFPAVGYYHGEVVASKRACSHPKANEAVIIGLSRTGELYVQWLATSDEQAAAVLGAPDGRNSVRGSTTGGAGSSRGAPSSSSSSSSAVAGTSSNNNKAGAPLRAVDMDANATMPTVFQRKRPPQREGGAVALAAGSVGWFPSHEALLKQHGWIPIACRKVCAAPAMKRGFSIASAPSLFSS